MPWKKRLLCATVCCMIMITLQGCKAASSGDFCTLYKPVYTAKADTQQTRDDANGNNAVWLALCQPP